MDKLTLVQQACVYTIPILFAITMHEAAHGYVAHRLGDDTAYLAGRITANPLKHIDLIGTVLVPIVLFLTTSFIFGWAKPVPVNHSRLHHPKRDGAIVALAGPGSNLLMAVMWAGFLKLSVLMLQHQSHLGIPLLYMSQAGIMINLVLMVLNLIPIPPLDGSWVVSSLLREPWSRWYSNITPFGFLIVLALLAIGVLNKILLPSVIWLHSVLLTLFHIQ
ncbi:MAG: site-2 protease family protein [Candidatus Berkiellales bacterium]